MSQQTAAGYNVQNMNTNLSLNKHVYFHAITLVYTELRISQQTTASIRVTCEQPTTLTADLSTKHLLSQHQ